MPQSGAVGLARQDRSQVSHRIVTEQVPYRHRGHRPATEHRPRDWAPREHGVQSRQGCSLGIGARV